jgi:hypothetical protein
MFTYSYESPNIKQIALKRLTGGPPPVSLRAVKKTLSDLAFPLHIVKSEPNKIIAVLCLLHLREVM